MTTARRLFALALIASAVFAVWLVWPQGSSTGLHGLVEVVPDREGPVLPVTTLETQGSVVPVGDETLLPHVDLIVYVTQLEIVAALEAVESAPPRVGLPIVPPGPSPDPVGQPQPAPEPQPEPEPELAEPVTVEASVWDRIAQCESGGNWHVNTGNGHYGGLQFTLQSWRGVGGTGYPHEHSREHQIVMGERLLAIQGWGAWPGCSRQVGVR